MNNNFFIGDTFMSQKSGLSQVEYSFAGATRSADLQGWEVSVLVTIANGYAGGASTLLWNVAENEEIRVSGKMKGHFLIDGLTKQKTKETPIKAIKFRNIQKDMIELEFI